MLALHVVHTLDHISYGDMVSTRCKKHTFIRNLCATFNHGLENVGGLGNLHLHLEDLPVRALELDHWHGQLPPLQGRIRSGYRPTGTHMYIHNVRNTTGLYIGYIDTLRHNLQLHEEMCLQFTLFD